jgi:hypothetical protein
MKRLIAGTFFVIIALLTLGGATQAAFPPVKFMPSVRQFRVEAQPP